MTGGTGHRSTKKLLSKAIMMREKQKGRKRIKGGNEVIEELNSLVKLLVLECVRQGSVRGPSDALSSLSGEAVTLPYPKILANGGTSVSWEP